MHYKFFSLIQSLFFIFIFFCGFNVSAKTTKATPNQILDKCETSLGDIFFHLKMKLLPESELGPNAEAARKHNQRRPSPSEHARLVKAVNHQRNLWKQSLDILRGLSAENPQDMLGKTDTSSVSNEANRFRDQFAAILQSEINDLRNETLRKTLGIASDGNPISIYKDPRTNPDSSDFVDIPRNLDVWHLLVNGKLHKVLSQMKIAHEDHAIAKYLEKAINNAMEFRLNSRNKVAVPTIHESRPELSELHLGARHSNQELEKHLIRHEAYYQGLWNDSSGALWETSIHNSSSGAQDELELYKSHDPKRVAQLGINAAQIHEVVPRLRIIETDESGKAKHISRTFKTLAEARKYIQQTLNISSAGKSELNKDLEKHSYRLIAVWEALTN